MTPLKEWESFYVIIGSSAGALIGLQFVVMTLVADRPVAPSRKLANALATPTIVHFSAVLLLSSLLSVPWHETPKLVWGLLGLAGIVYSGIVARRVRTQTEYTPDFEDWFYYMILPCAAYAVLAVTALEAGSHEHGALFGVATAALLLLFDGIHNAWDSVTYHITSKREAEA